MMAFTVFSMLCVFRRMVVYLWVFPTTSAGLLFLPLALFSGGGAQWHEGVLEIHGGWVGRFLRKPAGIFLEGGASAMTLGHVVLGLDPATLRRTRSHERIHVRQCERWGPLFIPAYLLASLIVWLRGRDGYLDNPFEREAYDKETPA
jgi:hypothetical protein